MQGWFVELTSNCKNALKKRKKSNPQKIRDSGFKKMKKKIRWLKNPSPLVKVARLGGFTIVGGVLHLP